MSNSDFDAELSILVCPTCQEQGTLHWVWNKSTTGLLRCTNKDCQAYSVVIQPEQCLVVDMETGEMI
jgi:Zn ribbon nucleic-acid-binding protein